MRTGFCTATATIPPQNKPSKLQTNRLILTPIESESATKPDRNNILNSLVQDDVDMILCGDDSEMKPKPDAHNIHLICSRLGVNPQQTVMVGDSTGQRDICC